MAIKKFIVGRYYRLTRVFTLNESKDNKDSKLQPLWDRKWRKCLKADDFSNVELEGIEGKNSNNTWCFRLNFNLFEEMPFFGNLSEKEVIILENNKVYRKEI